MLGEGGKDAENSPQRRRFLLLLTGTHTPYSGYSVAEMKKKTDVSERSQRAIRKDAYDRGFRPEEGPQILKSYLIDGVISNRSKEILKDKLRILSSEV